MGDPARRLATYDDLLALPEGQVGEIYNGELHASPRPRRRHAAVQVDMTTGLHGAFGRRRGGDGPGGWWILPEPELHLGRRDPRDRVLVPDLAGWKRDRLPASDDITAFTVLPDWVCEILSPGADAIRRDRVLKPEFYAQAGVPHLWIVDPDAQILEVYALHGDVYARIQAFAGDVCVRAAPFDAVELDLGGWWLPEEPPG